MKLRSRRSPLYTSKEIAVNQALILMARGDLAGAMTLMKEQKRICRELGNVENFAISLANQALILSRQGRHREALALAEEAYRLVSSHGYAALAKQILPILEQVRNLG